MRYLMNTPILNPKGVPLLELSEDVDDSGKVTVSKKEIYYDDVLFSVVMNKYAGDEKVSVSEKRARYALGMKIAQSGAGISTELSVDEVSLLKRYLEKADHRILLFGRLNDFLDTEE